MTKRRIAWTSVITAVLLAVMLAGAVWFWMFPNRDFLWITSNVEKNMAFFARGFAKMFFSHYFLIVFAVLAGMFLWNDLLFPAGRGCKALGRTVKVLSAVGISLALLPLLFSLASCVTELSAEAWQFVVGIVIVVVEVSVFPVLCLLMLAAVVLLGISFFVRFKAKQREL